MVTQSVTVCAVARVRSSPVRVYASRVSSGDQEAITGVILALQAPVERGAQPIVLIVTSGASCGARYEREQQRLGQTRSAGKHCTC